MLNGHQRSLELDPDILANASIVNLPIHAILHSKEYEDLNLFKDLFHFSVYDLCLCTRCMPGACLGQKRALDTLELELWTLVGPHVHAGNWTSVLCKNTGVLNC